MLYSIPILLSIVGQSQSKIYRQYKRAECGEVISADRGTLLPVNEDCDIYVIPSPGKTTSIDFFWPEDQIDFEALCDRIQIIGETTKTVHSPCTSDIKGAYFFTGNDKIYTIKVKNLPRNIHTHVTFVASKYTCNERLKYDMWGIPIEFYNNGPDMEICPLIIPTASLLKIERMTDSYGVEMCPIQIEVSQGPDIGKATTSTGTHCLDSEPLEVSVYCKTAILFLSAPQNASVKVTVLESTERTTSRYSENCLPKLRPEPSHPTFKQGNLNMIPL